MKELSFEKMEDILLAHEVAELEGDLEATMATVSDNPHYEFPSHGWAADGVEAIREHYRRTLPTAQQQDVAADKRVHAAGPNALLREAWVSFNRDGGKGERVTGLYLVVITFDAEQEKISGERMYTDAYFAEMMAPHLGEDYGNFPGVSVLSSTAPKIARHDAFAFAASRGITIRPPALS